MGLLNQFLSGVDNLKKKTATNIWDALNNPQAYSEMIASRMQEDRYGGPEEAAAMKQYLSRQPYDATILARSNDALSKNLFESAAGSVNSIRGLWNGMPMKQLGGNMALAPSTSETSNVRRMLDKRSSQGLGVIPANDKQGGFFVTVDGFPVFREATQSEAESALKDVDINFWRGELSNIYGQR